MDLFAALKNLKSIEADKNYTAKSRGIILGGNRRPLSFSGFVFRGLETAASLALAGLLIFAILGGIAAWDVSAPAGKIALNPENLRAEAEAIDIQIKLIGLDYEEILQVQSGGESTDASIGGAFNISNETTTPSVAVPRTITAPSIDEALELLSY